jgi:Bifunctional DNA primase/polymerase, N-terminal/AAA domain
MSYETEAGEGAALSIEEMLNGPPETTTAAPKATVEAVSKHDASLGGAAQSQYSTEPLGNASENALIAANLNPPDGSPDMRALADEYAKVGWCPTPLRPNGKAPILLEFNKRATNDRARVRDIFSDALGEPRDCNIGIVNGTLLPDGRELFIVDPDTKEQSGGPGVVSFNQRIKEIQAATGCPLPGTVTSRSVTPGYRGGALWFSAPRGTYRGHKPSFLPHVDIPIQAVSPGSTINGRAYEWEPGRALGEIEIAEAPQALIDAYHAALGPKPKAEHTSNDGEPPAPVIEPDRPDIIEEARKWLRDEAPHAGDGRSGTSYVVSYLFSHFALSPETAVDVLMDGDDSWNETKTKYPWGYDEDDANGGGLIRLANDLYARRTKAPGSSARVDIGEVFEAVEGVEAPTPELAEKIAGAHAAHVATEAAEAARAEAIAAEKPHTELSGAAWRRLVLPPKEYLLGQVFHRTSRWMVYGGTGAGKTLFKMDMFGAMASGKSFLNWEGSGRPARVLYLDGEIAADTFQERVVTTLDRYGCDDTFFAYNRDVLGEGEMPPLNTDKGEAWLWRKIEATQPDAICFDSLFCLAIGDMRDEESWSRLQNLNLKITAKRIAQAWVHHTGHNADHGYGSKVKEWGMTAVLALKANEKKTESARAPHVQMTFDKARERNEKNWTAFASQEIAYTAADGWAVTGAPAAKGAGGRKSDRERFEDEMLGALARLDGGQTGKKIAVDALRDELKAAGELEPNDQGKLPGSERMRFQRARHALCDRGELTERNGLVWRAGK